MPRAVARKRDDAFRTAMSDATVKKSLEDLEVQPQFASEISGNSVFGSWLCTVLKRGQESPWTLSRP